MRLFSSSTHLSTPLSELHSTAYLLDLFRYHFRNNTIYKAYCAHLNVQEDAIKRPEEIPFLPIEFFKSKNISLTEYPERVFQSSGTTGSTKSKHYVYSTADYLQTCRRIFEKSYGSLSNYTFLCLLPSYLERDDASLVTMCQYFIEQSEDSRSGFYLNNLAELSNQLSVLREKNKKTLLIGVTFALLDFFEQYPNLYFDNLIIMETGGMKGRKKELTRQEVHHILKEESGASQIHSEYGMTELLSQAYSKGRGVFLASDFIRIYRRDITDPLSVSARPGTGALNIIDLANTMSCPFIATQDIVRIHENGQFEILGRTDHSDIRGCNLMVI